MITHSYLERDLSENKFSFFTFMHTSRPGMADMTVPKRKEGSGEFSRQANEAQKYKMAAKLK